MKEIVVFVILKMFEIVLVILLPYWVARSLVRFEWYRSLMLADEESPCGALWGMGATTIIMIGVIGLIVVGVLIANWTWTTHICGN